MTREPLMDNGESMDQDDFFSPVEVDQHRLDEEWINLPKEYSQRAHELAEAKMAYASAKSNYELVVAELVKEIKINPDSFGISAAKVTDKLIDAMVRISNKHKKAKRQLINAEHVMDVTRALVDALDFKKKALENLTFLWGKDYYSSPRPPKGLGGERMIEQTAQAIFAKRSKKPKKD